MKILLLILCMWVTAVQAQTKGYLRYDSVIIMKNGGNGELIIENGSRGVTGGVLTNTGNGRTAFQAAGVSPFDATVEFSVNTNPNTVGTTFNPNTPQLTTKIYVSTIDGSLWTWNGTTYINYEPIHWGIFGNSGTNPALNFLGTTDPVDFTVKVENAPAIELSASNLSTAFWGSTASGSESFATNTTTIASGESSAAFNNSTTASGYSSLSAGIQTKSKSYGGTVVGTFNDSTDATAPAAYSLTNRAFQIGVGTADNARSNAMTVLFNGETYLPLMASGVGTKSVRIDPASGLLTYADTTSGGSGLTVGTTTITSGTAGRLLYEGSGNVLQQSANFAIDDAGKVLGLGAPTINTWTNTSAVIQSGNNSIFFGQATDFWLSGNARFNSGWFYKANGKSGNIGINEDMVMLRTAATGVADAALTWVVPIKADGTTGAIGGNISQTSGDYTGATLIANTTRVGIGGPVYIGDITTAPNASAALDVTSTTKGVLLPRMTATQGSAITGVNGLMIYVTDTNGTFTSVGFWGYEAGAWIKL